MHNDKKLFISEMLHYLYTFYKSLEVRKYWQKRQESPNSHVYKKSFVF